MQCAHANDRRQVRSWLGRHFNHVVLAGPFLWVRVFNIIFHECTRYTFAVEFHDMAYDSVCERL